MGFMEPEITGKMSGWQIETTQGTYYLPGDVETARYKLQDYVEGEIQDLAEDVTEVIGYFGRYAAPGYLDCTDWHFCADSVEALAQELKDYYGDGEEDGDEYDDSDDTGDDTGDDSEV